MTAWRERARAAIGSLKFRLTVGALAALVLAIGMTTALLVGQAERDTLAAAASRERGEARQLSEALAQRLEARRTALQIAAMQLDRRVLEDPERLRAEVASRPALISLFGSVQIAGADGRVRVELNAGVAARPNTDLSDREHFRTTVARQRPVTLPLAGDTPALVMTQPLVDASGLYGVIAARLPLPHAELFGSALEHSAEDDRSLYVVADAHGTIVSHPDPLLLLRPLSAEPRLARAAERAPRSTVADDGDDLVTTAPVPGERWQVWLATSRSTLLEPLHGARREALAWAAGITLLMAVLLYGLLGVLLRPLRQLELRAQHLFDGSQSPHDGWPEGEGEIGQLARVLRHVSVERAQLEQFNGEVLRKFSSVMSAAPVGIAFMRNQRFELIGAEFARLTGRGESDLIGERASVMLASDSAQRRLAAQSERAFRNGGAFVGEGEIVRGDGSRFWAQLRGRPVDAGDPSAGAIWTVSDISDELAERERLEWSATHDPLTRLANRKAFDQRAQRLFSLMPRTLPAALAVIDLDHFKPINDNAGHAAGDAMLQAVADAITGCIRQSDLAVRFGGDEFAILLEHCPHDAALRVAENVRAAITAIALPWQGRTLQVGASVGVASLGAEAGSVADWVHEADAACYAAKAAGRGAVRAAARPALRVVGGSRTEF